MIQEEEVVEEELHSLIPGQVRANAPSLIVVDDKQGLEIVAHADHKDWTGSTKSKISTSNADSQEQLHIQFKQERDEIIEHLRHSLDMLFLRQAERMMRPRSGKKDDASGRKDDVSCRKEDASCRKDDVSGNTALAGNNADTSVVPFAPLVSEEKDVPMPLNEPKQFFADALGRDSLSSEERQESIRPSVAFANQCSVIPMKEELEPKKPRSILVDHCISKASAASRDGGGHNANGHSSEGTIETRRGLTIQKTNTARRFSEIEKARQKMSIANHTVDLDFLMNSTSTADHKQDGHALLRFVKSIKFEICAAVLLFSNIALLGLQVEIQASADTRTDMPIFKTINTIYCFAFVVELGLRIFAQGFEYVWGPDFLWGWFDFVVVVMQVVETVIAYATNSGAGSTFSFVGRLVRIARVARVVRAIRIMRFLHGFKVLIDAIVGTLLSCVWALILLVIIIYVFSLIFAQFAQDFLFEQENPEMEFTLLDFYFGNFSSSMFTLFKSIVGGIDWQESVIELTKLGGIFVFLFIVYITLMQFAVINVIAGLFLQSAIEQAQQDQDHLIQLRLAEKERYVQQLKKLFSRLDTSHDGEISLYEFEAHLKEERVQAFFAGLEIENADAWTIFKLLDTDGGGAVDYAEFVEGCIRLKGSAKSIEMAQLMYHHKWIMDKVCELAEFIYDHLQAGSEAQKDTLVTGDAVHHLD